jgi:hypothetical protein
MVNPSGVVEELEGAGLEVEYSPEKGEIIVKGDVKEVFFFGVQELVLKNGKKNVSYVRYDGDNFVEVYDDDDGDEDEEPETVYLGRDLEVIVRYTDGHLVITYPNPK